MEITRHEWFKGLAGLLLGGFALSNSSKAQPPARERVLRVAHLTDIHLEPNHPSVEGFIRLDGTYPAGNGYIARLDEEQFEWLKEDLKRTPPNTPILGLGHQPILSVSAYLDGIRKRYNLLLPTLLAPVELWLTHDGCEQVQSRNG